MYGFNGRTHKFARTNLSEYYWWSEHPETIRMQYGVHDSDAGIHTCTISSEKRNMGEYKVVSTMLKTIKASFGFIAPSLGAMKPRLGAMKPNHDFIQ